MYYHYLTYRCNGRIVNTIIGSDCDNLDDAYRERCRMQAQLHPNIVIAFTTHNIGMGPAYSQKENA